MYLSVYEHNLKLVTFGFWYISSTAFYLCDHWTSARMPMKIEFRKAIEKKYCWQLMTVKMQPTNCHLLDRIQRDNRHSINPQSILTDELFHIGNVNHIVHSVRQNSTISSPNCRCLYSNVDNVHAIAIFFGIQFYHNKIPHTCFEQLIRFERLSRSKGPNRQCDEMCR